jgi:proprotein convertase subtilisin/kexin type 5
LECTKCSSLLGCQACITGYYLYNGTCLSGCISGSGATCKSACPFNNITQTITYADTKSQSCVEICPILNTGGSFGYNITLTCVISCPINYYNSNITRRCELCVDGCNNCTSPTVCFSCYAGYIFSKSLCVKQCSITLPFYYKTTCVSSCFDGTYLMTDLVTCGPCSSICLTCSKIASNCTKCNSMYLYNYNCVSKCPDNYYPDDGLCKVCTATAVQCNVPPLTYTLTTKPSTSGDYV